MGIKKQVIQYKDGKEVQIYASATEAAKELNTIKSTISKCCCGKIKEYNGFTFSYSGLITNKILNNKPVKCPYCDRTFDNYNGLCKHVLKEFKHGKDISREQLLTDYKYNGKRPKCKCGCGMYTTIVYTNGAHFSDYVIGHHNRVHNNWDIMMLQNKSQPKQEENSMLTEQEYNGTRVKSGKKHTQKSKLKLC